MESLPGEEENRQKDIIIARSPMLRVFVDKYSEKDPDMWLRMLENIFKEKKEEIIALFGEETIDKDVNIYLRVAKEYCVFNPEVEKDTRIALIFCFAWMGYEIGDENEVDLFKDDVLKQLYIFNTLKQTEETEEYVREVMKCGVIWRKEVGDDTPQVFKDFISKIDFP